MADDGDRNEATPQEVRSMLRELTASQRETDRHMRETDRRLRKLDELFNGQCRGQDDPEGARRSVTSWTRCATSPGSCPTMPTARSAAPSPI